MNAARGFACPGAGEPFLLKAPRPVNDNPCPALGQFASPYFVASGPATLNVHLRTPRAAGPLAPRLARNLPQCQRPNWPTIPCAATVRFSAPETAGFPCAGPSSDAPVGSLAGGGS